MKGVYDFLGNSANTDSIRQATTLETNKQELFLMVPLNVSSHDLQENHFANTKLDEVTATNKYVPTIIIVFYATRK